MSETLPVDVVPPPAPTWNQAQYAKNFQALLPTGPAWPRDPDATQSSVCAALVPTYVRSTEAAAALIADAFPSTAGDMLTDWESSLGLPDPCAGEAPTTAGRIAQVVARFVAGGGQSIPYFINFLANLGFTATVTEFTTARCGMPANIPAFNDPWSFAWLVEIGTSVTTAAAVAVCELERMAPAHTIVGVTVAGVPISDFILDQTALDSATPLG